MPAQTVIKLRRDSAADWASVDPILAEGELGIETDTKRIKIGDGATEWSGLAYGPAADTMVIKVKNASGTTAIPAGQLVQFAGAAGDTVTVSPAVTDGSVDFHNLVGLTSTELGADGFGDVVVSGVLGGLDTSAYTVGTLLYADPANAGQLTSTAPTAPAFKEPVAAVTRSGNGTSGLLLVRLHIGASLNDIHDVALSSPASGDVLQFDGTKWGNAPIDIPPGTVIAETAPSGPDSGQLWWNSATGTLYIYYDATWVEVAAGTVGPQGPAGADGATGPEGPAGADGGFSSTQTVETVGTGRALTSADAGKLIINSAGITITVQGLSVGQQVDFLQNNAAQITFTPGSGITLNSKGGNRKTAAQYSPASIKCVATNSYVLIGDLVA